MVHHNLLKKESLFHHKQVKRNGAGHASGVTDLKKDKIDSDMQQLRQGTQNTYFQENIHTIFENPCFFLEILAYDNLEVSVEHHDLLCGDEEVDLGAGLGLTAWCLQNKRWKIEKGLILVLHFCEFQVVVFTDMTLRRTIRAVHVVSVTFATILG